MSKQYKNREFTARIRELMAMAHELQADEKGELHYITKGEAMAQIVMKMALGHKETVEVASDTTGQLIKKDIIHKPVAWAIQLIWDRLEGKTPQALPDDKSGMTAAKKVRKLTTDRINALAKKAVENTPGPPVFTRKQ